MSMNLQVAQRLSELVASIPGVSDVHMLTDKVQQGHVRALRVIIPSGETFKGAMMLLTDLHKETGIQFVGPDQSQIDEAVGAFGGLPILVDPDDAGAEQLISKLRQFAGYEPHARGNAAAAQSAPSDPAQSNESRRQHDWQDPPNWTASDFARESRLGTITRQCTKCGCLRVLDSRLVQLTYRPAGWKALFKKWTEEPPCPAK